MGKDKEFRTIRGYELLRQKHNLITPSMEDYLEMAYRIYQQTGCIRIGDLASRLNVRPPSASRMVQKLARKGYLIGEKYGVIELTKKETSTAATWLPDIPSSNIFNIDWGYARNWNKLKNRALLAARTVARLSMFIDFAENNPQWQETFHLPPKLERNKYNRCEPVE